MSVYGRMLAESHDERSARIRREQRNRILGITALFLAMFGAGVLAGGLAFYRLGFDKATEIERAKPRPVASAPAPVVEMSRAECERTCYARARMSRVK